MRYSLPLILIATASIAGAQQQSQALTLQDAVAMAQKQGPSAQIARSFRDAARSRNDAFNAGLLPQVMLSGQAANLNRSITAVTAGDGTTQFVQQAQNQSTLGI